jgi:uncharacterized membrane protein
MASQARSAGRPQNKWVRPIVPLVIIAIVASVLLYLGGFIAAAQGATDDAALPLSRWLGVVLAAIVILYGLYVGFADKPIWTFGTREVVYAAIGAALYGVLSWATNIFQLPSISLVALRPAVVIPVFFGIAFGPLVGFFSGFVGNILGDALTGWGVYPLWDVGNGLLGFIPGLIVAFSSRKRALDTLTIAIAVISLLATGLILANASFTVADFSGNEIPVGPLWWVPLLAGVLAVGARFLFAKREDLAAAEIWGALGIVLGIGFAAFGGIIQNGTSLGAAFFGEFVPAAGSNLINVLILLPILLTAWAAAQARTGR